MRPDRALCVFLSLLLFASSACTKGRMVPLQMQPGATAPPGLKAGDRVRVHTHDGKHSDFDFDHVSSDGDVFGRNHERVLARDIAMVERRSVDKTRTSLLIAASAVGVLVLFVVLQLASDDWYLTGY